MALIFPATWGSDPVSERSASLENGTVIYPAAHSAKSLEELKKTIFRLVPKPTHSTKLGYI